MDVFKPFLKYPGNKIHIIDRIIPRLPKGKCLREPFVGSGAVFLNSDFESYILGDSNPHLITLYKTLVTKDGFIEVASTLFDGEQNNEAEYYRLRDLFNSENEDPYLRSLTFVYLNRHCYNGLIRYNKSGKFNVPFGRYDEPLFPRNEMYNFRKKARATQTEFVCADFEDVMSQAVPGDVIYCDPPYVPLNSTSNFTEYDKNGFGLDEQKRLARVARETAGRGIPVLLSNRDTELVRDLYHGAEIESLEAPRYISCKTETRGKDREVLILFKGE